MIQQVVVIAEDGVLPFELGIPGRVLGSALDSAGAPAYEVNVCTLDDGPVIADGGFTIIPQAGIAAVAAANIVIIAPSSRHVYVESRTGTSELRERLETTSERCRIFTICIGSFALAATGVLDGHTVTTHWWQTGAFASQFPLVRVDPDALYVADGRYMTSAGAAAGVDMLLHVVREDHGSESANHVARLCVVPGWREGGQRQFVAAPLPSRPTDSVGTALEWALANLGDALSLDALARRAHMGRRTFSRKMREATGLSAGEWILRHRLELARRLLETTNLPVDDVAHQAGLGSGSSLRKHLQTCVGISPSAYRRAFHSSPGVNNLMASNT